MLWCEAYERQHQMQVTVKEPSIKSMQIMSPSRPACTALSCARLIVLRPMHCLGQIGGISLLDHITNSVILKQCESFSIETQLRSKRLRWFGHICRMSDSRLPKVLMHGQLVGLDS